LNWGATRLWEAALRKVGFGGSRLERVGAQLGDDVIDPAPWLQIIDEIRSAEDAFSAPLCARRGDAGLGAHQR
jgi:hypothetical protein